MKKQIQPLKIHGLSNPDRAMKTKEKRYIDYLKETIKIDPIHYHSYATRSYDSRAYGIEEKKKIKLLTAKYLTGYRFGIF